MTVLPPIPSAQTYIGIEATLTAMAMRSIGLDFGSVYVKGVLLGVGHQIELSFSRRKSGDDAPAIEEFLRKARELHPGAGFRLGVSGIPPAALEDDRVVRSNALVAIAAGVRELHPDAESVIEVGGHTSKFLVLSSRDRNAPIRDFATNEACAAGTGSFLEQQARRLELTVEELAALSCEAKSGATVAGRCSVFAKSDMIHLQQKATPVEEIAYGLCLAICRNALGTLLKGREVPLPVVIAGGCARNGGVVRAFRETLGSELVVSAQPGLETAIGAAVAARSRQALAIPANELFAAVRAMLPSRRRAGATGALLIRADRLRPAEPVRPVDELRRAFLGVDVGSVSTDLVLLDSAGELLSSVYLPTRGRPVDVLLEGLATLRARFPAGLRIEGCGATGSGRHLAARLLDADVVKNEITCQMLGAQRYVPAVDTILEIGGQDSKFISLRNGAIADFAMNKICAAGTGSFLEEQAREMGIAIERDFAARAFAARAPLDLGTRCTVYMETEVVGALQDGAAVEDICAGLAHSIVRNYLDRVVGSRPIGSTIVFQGGVASNEAVVAAFEAALGTPVHVHPYNRLSGAIGAALAAREAVGRGGVTKFRAVEPEQRPSLRSFECRHCANRCEVNVISVAGERAFFGDTCERYTSRTAKARETELPPNIAEEYLTRCEAEFTSQVSGLTIGIPRASVLFGSLAFWATFFKELGHRPVLSPPSSEETLTLGLRNLAVGVCLPIKLTAGHVHELVARGVDLVFVPSVVLLPGDDPSRSYSCPYAMAVPFIVSTKSESRFLAPVVSFQSEEAFVDSFEPHRAALGASRNDIREAWRTATAVQAELDEEFRARAQRLIAGRGERRVFAVLGKPYNTLDGHLNLSLFERLRRMDILAIPQRLLPVSRDASDTDLPWRFAAEIHEAAAAVAKMDGVHPVLVSNFGCGPDAFTFRQVEEVLEGKPHLLLEFDEHRGEAGMITRIEAFLDQLEAAKPTRRRVTPVKGRPAVPPKGTIVRIPNFADHAHAFAGLLRWRGCEAEVLPLPTPEVRALGNKHSLGKECHAYSMIAADLVELSRVSDGREVTFFFPGTGLPCLLHQYGNGMRTLLRDLGIDNVTVCAPSGTEMLEGFGLDGLERFYQGLMSIELLTKAVCQVRPYELEKGRSDAVHRTNLRRIEDAIASGDVLAALDESLGELASIATEGQGTRPIVGMAGDVYTKNNPAANDDLVRWLEEQGLEVWPSPFQIDLLDFSISRSLWTSVAALDLGGLLRNGSLAADRAVQQWRVRRVVANRIARQDEPGYLEMKKLTAPYMPNEAHTLLFINVAKIVDFARNGADGIINAICFNCMIGNASAAITEKIRRDYDDVGIVTAVYADGDDPSRRMVLEAFVSQVFAHNARRRERRVPPRGWSSLVPEPIASMARQVSEWIEG